MAIDSHTSPFPIKKTIRGILFLLSVFACAAYLDILLQFGEGSNADAVFQSVGSYSFKSFWPELKIGLLCTGAMLLMPARFAILALRIFWSWICLVEAVETIVKYKFGISLDGDWLMILLGISSEEMSLFWGEMFKSWVFWMAAFGGSAGICLGNAFCAVVYRRLAISTSWHPAAPSANLPQKTLQGYGAPFGGGGSARGFRIV